MTRKSKRALICTNASAARFKKRRQSLASSSLDTSALLDASLDTSASLDNTSLDTSLDSSVFLEPVQENTDPTCKDSLRSLGVFLCNVFTSDIGMKLTESAELSARIVGKSDRTVRQWRTDIIDDKGKLTHTKQGLQGATVEREFCGS